MAIYRIKNKKTGDKNIVITRTKAGAINYVASEDYEAETIGAGEMMREVKKGVPFNDLSEEEAEGVEGEQKLPLKDTEKETTEAAKGVAAKAAAIVPQQKKAVGAK